MYKLKAGVLKRLCLVAGLFLTTATSAQTVRQANPLPTLKVSERSHDFGTIGEDGGLVKQVFQLTNTGKTAITVSDVAYGCNCLTVEYPKKKIMPNRTARLTVTYNPAGRPGFFSKELRILTDGGKHCNRIWVKGTVTARKIRKK